MFNEKNIQFFAFDDSLPSPDRIDLDSDCRYFANDQSFSWNGEMHDFAKFDCGTNEIVSSALLSPKLYYQDETTNKIGDEQTFTEVHDNSMMAKDSQKKETGANKIANLTNKKSGSQTRIDLKQKIIVRDLRRMFRERFSNFTAEHGGSSDF